MLKGIFSHCSGYPEWLGGQTFSGKPYCDSTRRRFARASRFSSGTLITLSSRKRRVLLKITSKPSWCFLSSLATTLSAVLYADSPKRNTVLFLDTDLAIVRSFSRQLSMALQIQDIEVRLQQLQVS